ncbi:uncharacterized protein G2W53_033304 [Senna tora]|uniref:Uncharacterized protein n=1 Tax=Senna tora TaxID=362788 RepID=A0A834W8D1_9FABA|nr:uncharacterized protein G2W53_033304 [Senna tora]
MPNSGRTIVHVSSRDSLLLLLSTFYISPAILIHPGRLSSPLLLL